QFVLSQPNSVSTNLGSTVKLSCKRSTGNIGSNYVSWYQHHEGRSPTTMIYRDDQRPDGVPDRFSGSIDRSSNSALLTIDNVQTEDEAAYFCHSYSTGMYIFGGGTKLTVLGQPKSTPTLTMFPPSPEELQENKATLVCLISNFSPSGVTVAWKANGTPITQGVDTSNPTKEDNKYMASSFLHLTSDQWRSHNSFTCQVTHEGNTVEKSLSPA
uniref:Antibody 85RF45.1 light chain n=1 Tax=Rattus norvegicus TaxID=10116 RepID=UPI000E6AE34C|nr:Chain B, Antibody 85RF45.1 light chain [Rattus norvegicus]6H5N_E Chain E, Antibody 85RF45.1 light chain [Rattus norvegicus]